MPYRDRAKARRISAGLFRVAPGVFIACEQHPQLTCLVLEIDGLATFLRLNQLTKSLPLRHETVFIIPICLILAGEVCCNPGQ